MSIISAGTSNTTSLVYTGDTTGAMVFQTNGTTEAMRIDTSQNVGIGTTSPSNAKLHVVGNWVGGNSTVKAQTITSFASGGITGYGTYDSNGTRAAILYSYDGGTVFGTQTSTPLVTEVGGVERMRIDTSGRITMPYQPAFHAVRTGGNVSSTGIFICNTVTYNDGNHYNSSTGRFTAPVAGRYQMNFFVLAQNGNNFDFAIRVNGSQYPGMDIRCNSGAIGGNFTLSCSAIFKLSAGDIVDPFISSYVSGPIYGLGLNGFSMYLLG